MSNVPTGPDQYWYRKHRGDLLPTSAPYIVCTEDHSIGLVYYETGSDRPMRVYDDGLWLGPVPMPGVDFEPCPTCGKIGEKHFYAEAEGPAYYYDLICDNGHEWQP